MASTDALTPWKSLEGRRVVVTGANGFVGGHLVPALTASGAQVFGASDTSMVPYHDPLYHHTVCDVRRPIDVQSLLSIAEPDALIHLAAQSHVPSAWDNPERTWRINLMGTLHLLRACAAQPTPPRFLMVSTGEVYGSPRDVPATEETEVRPANPYAASKAAAEILVRQVSDAGQVPATIVRPFNHTGPRQSPQFVCANFAEQIARIEADLQPPVITVGDLSPRRDFLDVRDVARAHILALMSGAVGQTFNVASGEPRPIETILDMLLRESDVDIEVEVDPARLRPTDTPVLAGDAARFREATGWKPEIPFEQTLRDLLAHFRQVLAVGG
jgi:GDP-4-dehydro-6-deoxy-D-mannose reductase